MYNSMHEYLLHVSIAVKGNIQETCANGDHSFGLSKTRCSSISVKISKFRCITTSVATCTVQSRLSNIVQTKGGRTPHPSFPELDKTPVKASRPSTACFVPFVGQNCSALRIPLRQCTRVDYHLSKKALRKRAHLLALDLGICVPEKDVCKRSEQVRLGRHERYFVCMALGQCNVGSDEPCGNNFLPAVWCGKTFLLSSRRKPGRRHVLKESDIESCMESPKYSR